MASTPDPVIVAILAKAPVPGLAKTRLVLRLGAAGAADLQARLIVRTVETAIRAAVGPVCLWCAPDAEHLVFVDLAARHGIALRAQVEGDLGQRMHAVVAAETMRAPVLLVGVDCPPLTAEHLRVCAAALRSHDAVLVPAEDGGYVLVGLRGPDARVFEDIAWGGPDVMADTRRRLTERRLSWCEPFVLWDLDRPEDLDRDPTLVGGRRDTTRDG